MLFLSEVVTYGHAYEVLIQKILVDNNERNIIVGGDLNDVFIPALDRYRSKLNAQETEYVKAWKVLCDEFNLSDFWRLINPTKKQYTWRQGSSATRLKQSRLDYWLVSIHMMYDLDIVDIKISTRSDHSLIELSFYKSTIPERGPSFWNFNASLLKDPEYVDALKVSFAQAQGKYDYLEDKGMKWDLIKMELRTSTICFSKTKAKALRENIKEVMLQVDKLEKEIVDNPSDENLTKYHEGKAEIDNYNNEKASGAQLRSKTDWVELGERNSKFFLNLEKRNYQKKCITKLINEKEEEISDPEKILKYEESFYQNLYSKPIGVNEDQKTRAKNIFNDDALPKISEENKQVCDKAITIKEVGEALQGLKNGKSPGSDGFTADFYKFFWTMLHPVVFDSLTHALEKGQLSIDQKRGIINLIPKKDKDPRLLKNWRPISLLNTDYKIITKLLANRVKEVLPTVINSDQVAYLKNRFIGQNIRTILDIMGYTKVKDQEGIIAFLDFEKAFDTINWDVIYDALALFNLGPIFISWVKTIYNQSEACVTNNGFSSPFFKLQRGVRQGCPLSAYLFIMVVELLAHKIRKSKNIRGIKIGETEIKLVQMADDTTMFVEDPDSLQNTFDLLKAFESYAGLRLNKAKTEAMWVGKNINNCQTPLNIKWVKQVHSLGIYYSYEGDYVMQKNFMDRAKEFKQILDMWRQRDLSLIGKITILKSLAFSKIIYQCGVLTIPPKYVETINELAYAFVWNNKPNKIKKDTLIADYSQGGLKMLDISSFLKAQKVMWVKRLLTPDKASWKALPSLYLESQLGLDIFKCRATCTEKPAGFPGFYWQVLQAWFETKELIKLDLTPYNIRKECIWLNKKITTKKKVLFWNDWHMSGINIIHDIINEEGKFLTVKEIDQKFDMKCNFLKYNKLKESIPQEWRKILKTQRIAKDDISFKDKIFLNINKNPKSLKLVTNKDIYWLHVKKKQVEPIIKAKLEHELGINEEDWESIFLIPKTVMNTKIRAFQYKVLFNLIPCNMYLKKIQRSDTDRCDQCGALDDPIHYFYECEQMETFWSRFNNWWKNMMDIELNLNRKVILVGCIDNIDKVDTLNACILIAKWHIYKNRLNNDRIFFYKFLCELKYALIIEKKIALRNNNLQKYNMSWERVENFIT